MTSARNIEELFRKELSGLEIQPSPGVWRKISSRIAWNSFVQFNPVSFNIYYAAILTAGAVIGLLLLTADFRSDTGLTESAPVMTEPVSPPGVQADGGSVLRDDKTPEGKTQGIISPVPFDEEKSAGEKAPGIERSDSMEDTVAEDQALEAVSADKTDSRKYSHDSPRAWFDVSVKEGCAPLKVEFRNYSSNAVRYNWSFGDGGSSGDRNPVYVFDEPGEYFVSMMAEGRDHTPVSHSEVIRVHPVPEVRFEIDIPDQAGDGRLVYLYNFTKGALVYRWDFGDGNFSDDKDPSHTFFGEGQYDIKLIAINDKGCMDSAMITDVLRPEEPVVRFPTAFSPNMTGPVGGYYSGRESNNDVFHPFTSETPVEYSLRIFNRHGNLIFESNDINMGWDGYFRQELQPPGVYVWKMRARFADGRTMVKAGDITLFWRQ